MGNSNEDVKRAEASAANINTTLINNQLGFDTTNSALYYKDSGGTGHTFNKTSTISTTDIVVSDNTQNAFRVRESTNIYFQADTQNGSEKCIIGNTTTNPTITVPGTGNFGIGTDGTPITNITFAGAGTTLTVHNASAYTGLEVGTTESDNAQTLGTFSFVNADNADASGPTSSFVAGMYAAVETSDSNAGSDSGADLYFLTKPESGSPATRMTMLSTGAISMAGTLTVNDTTTVQNSATDSIVEIKTFSATGGTESDLNFYKSASDTLDTLVGTADGDDLGQIQFFGVNSSNAWRIASSIKVQQDAALSGASVPSRIIFSTSGTSGNVEAMCIDDSQNIGIKESDPDSALEVNGTFHTTGTALIEGVATLGDNSTLASSAAPVADAEIANKKYVDDQLATIDTWDEVMHNGNTFTVADTENLSATITQNDTTNNPAALVIANTGSGNDITLPNSATIKNGVATFTTIVGTLTTAAQTNITSLGTLTALTVDDITLNGNTMSSAGASALSITPTAGQILLLDGHWGFDGVAFAAQTDANTTMAAYAGKNITIESVTFDGGAVAGVTSLNATGNCTLGDDRTVDVHAITGITTIDTKTATAEAFLVECNGKDYITVTTANGAGAGFVKLGNATTELSSVQCYSNLDFAKISAHSSLRYYYDEGVEGQEVGDIQAHNDGTNIAEIEFQAGADVANKDDGRILFQTATGGSLGDVLLMKEDKTSTFSNNIVVEGSNSSIINAGINIIGTPAGNRPIRWRNTNVSSDTRWDMGKDSTAEGGSDSGSNFYLRAFTDAGVAIDSPLTIDRVAGGLVTVSRPLLVAGDVTFSGAGSGLLCGEISVADNVTAMTPGTSFTQVTAFDTNGISNDVTSDHTNDHLITNTAGNYMVVISLTVNNDEVTAHEIDFQLFKNNGDTEFTNVHVHRSLAGSSDVGSVSMSGIIACAASDTIELWVQSDTAAKDIIVSDCTLSLYMIGK